MRDNVRRAALEAAAKLTMTVTVLAPSLVGGCKGADPPPQTPTGESSGSTTSTPTSTSPASTGAPAIPGTAKSEPASEDCVAVVKNEFPTPSKYPGTKKSVSQQVVACCQKLLSAHDYEERRWDCCANTKDDKSFKEWFAACTPWGPPVPPAMVVA